MTAMTRDELLAAAEAAHVWPAGHGDAIAVLRRKTKPDIVQYADWRLIAQSAFH